MDQKLVTALKEWTKKYTMVTAERKYCIPWKVMYTMVTKMGLHFICNDDMMKNKKSR